MRNLVRSEGYALDDEEEAEGVLVEGGVKGVLVVGVPHVSFTVVELKESVQCG